MANYESLKETIKNNIKPNASQEITGILMQNTLLEMVDVIESQTGWDQSSSIWLDKLNGTDPNYVVQDLGVLTKSIKDIWFSFPDGKPSWWDERTPQLRALNGETYGSPKIRFYFRQNQSEEYLNWGVDYDTNYQRKLELWKIPVSLGESEPTFFIYVYIDTTPLMGLSTSILNSEASQAIQPCVVKKIHCGLNTLIQRGLWAITGKIKFDKELKRISIPDNTTILLSGGIFLKIRNSELDLSSVSPGARLIQIYFDTNTEELTYSPTNEKADTNVVYGGDKVLIGEYDQVNNSVYFWGWNWESGGLDRGIDYVGEISSSKSILANTPIIYDPDEFTLTVFEGTRIISAKSDIISVVPGKYNLLPGSDGYTNIYITDSGSIVTSLYDKNQTYNLAKYMWIGWIHPASNVPGNYFFPGLADGSIVLNKVRSIPQIFNSPIRRKSIDTPLRMICFGSSWFMDTWWYLNKIIQSAGINAELTCFYTGGAYFSEWINRWDNDSVVDCWKSTNGSDWSQTTAPFKTTLLEGWDIIAYQQGAYQSIDWAKYWNNQWSKLLRYVKQSCGIDTVIAFNSTWAPSINGDLAPFENDIDGQRQWQLLNFLNTSKFMSLSGIDNISPNGSLMWAMRRSPELNFGNDLASDNLHPDNGLPIYGLAGCFFETFIAPMYGVSFDAVEWLPDESTPKAPVSGSTFQAVSKEQRNIIRQMIKLAMSDRFGFNDL